MRKGEGRCGRTPEIIGLDKHFFYPAEDTLFPSKIGFVLSMEKKNKLHNV